MKNGESTRSKAQTFCLRHIGNMHTTQQTTRRTHSRKVRYLLEAVKIEQSLFALPFAYVGMILAAKGVPDWEPLLWVTVAMVGARNAGMAFNRVFDRHVDALNPRTAGRHLPRGILRTWELSAIGFIGLVLLFVAAAQLNPLALLLSPVAAFAVVAYSLVKHFSWLTSFALGLTLAIAPAGGWIGVTGSFSWEVGVLVFIVSSFATGFDIFNTAPDVDFDHAHDIQSLPARFGLPVAFRVAKVLHFFTSVSLLALGLISQLQWPYYIGWVIATGLLVYEHWVISPTDLSKLGFVFSKINALISISVLVFTLVAILS